MTKVRHKNVCYGQSPDRLTVFFDFGHFLDLRSTRNLVSGALPGSLVSFRVGGEFFGFLEGFLGTETQINRNNPGKHRN